MNELSGDNGNGVGHEIGVSAERVGGYFPQVWLSVLNYVTDAAGNLEPDLHLTPAQARDLGGDPHRSADRWPTHRAKARRRRHRSSLRHHTKHRHG